MRKCRGTWSAANSTRPEPAGSQAGAFDGQPGGVARSKFRSRASSAGDRDNVGPRVMSSLAPS